MKNLIVIVLLLSGLNTIGQKSNSIELKAGQKIIASSKNSQQTDMGMAGSMTNNSMTTTTLTVTGVKGNDYTLTNTVNKLKVDMDVMGQKVNYDSEKPEDQESEAGKTISPMIGKNINLTLNKFSGKKIVEKDTTASPEKPEANPISDMLGGMGNNSDEMMVADAFFLIPYDKKKGDSWTITDSTLNKKSVTTYTLKSLDKNIATITFNTALDMQSVVEAQGTEMNITMNTKTNGEIVADAKTGIINKRTSASDVAGALDVMGQSMPITSKNTEETVFTVEVPKGK
jgi:hypothetical protein